MGGTVLCAHQTTNPTTVATRTATMVRRFQLLTPRSNSRVRAKDEPRKCKFRVERINHQPATPIQKWPAKRRLNRPKNNDGRRMENWERNSLNWTRPRRLMGAGKRKAISASVKSNAAR